MPFPYLLRQLAPIQPLAQVPGAMDLSRGASADHMNFLTVWWLDFKSEDLKRTRWKMHCLCNLAVEVTLHPSVIVTGSPRLKGGEHMDLTSQREEYTSHIIR